MTSVKTAASAFALLALTSGMSAAHVVLEKPATEVGKPYKAVFKVTHGCKGSPTVKVIVEFPEGIIAVKPMPKAGWQIATEKAPYAKEYKFYHGMVLKEGVKRIVWSGGSLPDDFYDEFVASAFIAAELPADQELAFTVTQQCEKGEMRWAETAEPEHRGHLERPAPILKLLPAPKGEHQH